MGDSVHTHSSCKERAGQGGEKKGAGCTKGTHVRVLGISLAQIIVLVHPDDVLELNFAGVLVRRLLFRRQPL